VVRGDRQLLWWLVRTQSDAIKDTLSGSLIEIYYLLLLTKCLDSVELDSPFFCNFWWFMEINDREMFSEENSQGVKLPQKRAVRGTSNIYQSLLSLIRIKGRFSSSSIMVITIGGIALAEVFAMIVINFARDLPYYLQVLLDAALMTTIIFPLLYFLLFNPLLSNIKQRQQSEYILLARLRLMQFANANTLDELLQFALDEVETLTGSTVSFFHFLEEDQKTLWLQAWSTNTLQNMCKAEGKGSHYDVEKAGVWADAVRTRQPVLHNNYAALPHRKGTPEGHALVIREMVIPILRDQKVVAILGLGNKPQDYTANDVQVVSTLADFAWDIVEHKRSENALLKSEEKFRTLADWTYDWEKWLDPSGNIVYTSPSCERMTGYTPDEFIQDPDLLIRIIHPDDQQFYEEHHKLTHDASAGTVRIEYRIISRDGSEHWLEHICRPLFGPEDQHLGRRISNREITERKQAEKKIYEQSQKELILTQTLQTIQTDIARDLHDTLGQNISFLRMNLEHLSEAQWGDPTNLKIQLQNMAKAANESFELVRDMLAMLQIETSADPIRLFTRYADQIAERSSFKSDFTSLGIPKQLSPHQIRQLFYIYREALSNIEKYANACQVSGEFIWNDQCLTLVISDNGCGFDPNGVRTSVHYGLKFMRERAELLKGSFSVQSAPAKGTTITVIVPYEHELSTPSQ
jgi:PAS domain S-box-containing protein